MSSIVRSILSVAVIGFVICGSVGQADTFNSPERIGWAPIFYTAHLPQSRALIIIE